jgi:outer membrane protein insertion porin family
MGAIVGGPFQWINTVEYLFPITADDTLRGVVFTDFGTVEPNVAINNMRVAPGFGMRITLPAMGPAPIALDFAFPVVAAPGDTEQIFSFFVGFAR